MHFEPVLRNEETIAVLAVGWNSEIEGTGRIAASMRMLAAETAMALERVRPACAPRGERAHRRPHRPAQPPGLGRGASARDGAGPPPERPALRGDARPRLLQELQRRARAPGRRPALEAERCRLGDRASDERHTRPLRRRRVHGRPPGCNLANAKDIVERLREAMPRDQTVSAGVACWNGRESAEELVGRADAALYEAKRTGRDRLVTAGGVSARRAQISRPVTYITAMPAR